MMKMMMASAGHVVAYTVGAIFKHIIDWLLLLSFGLLDKKTRFEPQAKTSK